MIYFGRNLRALKGGVAEPALIDPARSVALSSDGFEPQSIPDWPSYADISPAARHAYLMWHSHGRVEPDAPISFVFLHFYGLERRLLSDLGASGSGDLEHQQLLQEVRRLLDIYGKNNSFRGYASAFLEFTEAVRLGRQNDVPFPEFSFTGYDIPARLKFALGAMSRAGQPIPAPWARAWAIADPSFSRRTPFQRCAPYFSLLFEARYRECFGDGVVVKPNRTLIRIEYHPASASFGGSLVFKSELPDITVLKEPIAKLRALAEECTNELDPYSRYLGRKPNGEKDLAALALLPPLLLSTAQVGHTRNLRDKIAQQVGTGLLLTRKELFSLAESSETATFGKRDAVTLAQTLAAMGFGIEPDVRFGGPVLSTSMRAYLFPLTAEAAAVSAPTQAYSAATVLIHLAALLSLADGTVTQEQEEQIEAHIGSALNLSEDERLRLDAHRHWVLTERPVLAGVKKRVESLALPQRQAIGRFLAGVASAGGDISPNEVNMLRQMYRMLDLNQQDVYSDAHQAATSPVTVLPAKEISAGFAIPQRRRAAEGRRLQLDASVVEATLKETAKVSALLASVFADETPPAPVAQPTEGADCVPGLDAEGSALVRVLVKKAAWSRGELEAIAAEGAMLLDGAIEAVNDLAIDCFDALALEGDDPIEVNISVLTSLIQRIAT
jgi:tellurite resistance protein